MTFHLMCVCVIFISVWVAGGPLFSSPEPKAHGELIVYQSSRRPSIRAHEKTLVEYT